MTDAAAKPTVLSTWRALNAALHDAMAEDDSTFIMGEDITTWGAGGGIYGVTRKLADAFGANRVRNVPISEEVIVSSAVGAALAGARPIVEIMYSDFSLLAMDAIVNQAAKARYMYGGQFEVPLVIRTNGGSLAGKAAQHSQCLETLFAHIPGLEVIVPGSPDDAYGLLRAAIKSPNPTIFLEHKSLYNERGPVRTQEIPIGVADIVRPGSDVTVVATQIMRRRALEAAELLAVEGISVEVVDPRTLAPLDVPGILESVARTRRLAVAHEAPALYGFAGEVIAAVTAELWEELLAPPRRFCGAHAPVAYAEGLEGALIPSTETLVAGLRDLVATEHRVVSPHTDRTIAASVALSTAAATPSNATFDHTRKEGRV